MYNFIMNLYSLGVRTAALFNDKVRKMWQGEQAAISVLQEKVDPNASYIWFHAASLGEFEQGRPLIEHIRHEFPQYKILLTFFSPSGYEVRKNYEGADIVCYLPLDTVSNARRFLRTIRPVMAFFIKYEFWYNYMHILRHRGVPVYSVSSIFRPDQVFFKWYGRKYANVLKCFTRLFVQNEESKRLLATLGINDVEVVGDTRFDRVLEIKEAAKQLPLVEKFTAQTEHVFMAGSSWLPDEELFIPVANHASVGGSPRGALHASHRGDGWRGRRAHHRLLRPVVEHLSLRTGGIRRRWLWCGHPQHVGGCRMGRACVLRP